MLGALQSKGTLNNNASYTDAYSMLVERIGLLPTARKSTANPPKY